jgi:hypothetical protein
MIGRFPKEKGKMFNKIEKSEFAKKFLLLRFSFCGKGSIFVGGKNWRKRIFQI